MRFTFIAAKKAEHTVTILCRCLCVTRSGFYAWQARPESLHARDDRRLKVLVHTSFAESRRNDGSPRVHDDLIDWQERVSRKRVVRLMQEEGLKARVRKRYKHTTMSDHDQPVAANLLDRRFEAAAPNQRWVGDTTEFVIATSGKLYLAVILDLFSRFVVGWALSAVNDRHLTIKALEMALKRRCPDFGLLHHSDQGCTYASEDYQDLLDARGIVCSMSRRGNCYDNAVMESFFSTVKNELADQFASHGDAKMELFDYIEVFYNQRAPAFDDRPHQSGGLRTASTGGSSSITKPSTGSDQAHRPPEFIGGPLTEKGGAPVLILLYPDGSQETGIFDHEDALVEGAMNLHNELLMSGWRLCPEPVQLEDDTRSLTSHRSASFSPSIRI